MPLKTIGYTRHPKMQTSIRIDPALYERAINQSQAMGMSFNAYVSMAVYRELENRPPILGVPEQYPLVKMEVPSASTYAQENDRIMLDNARRRAEKQSAQKAEQRAKDLRRFGPYYKYISGEDPEPLPVSWDDIEKYILHLNRTPPAVYMKRQTHEHARALGVSIIAGEVAENWTDYPSVHDYFHTKYGIEGWAAKIAQAQAEATLSAPRKRKPAPPVPIVRKKKGKRVS